MRTFILWGIAGLAVLLLPACKVTETEYIDSYYTVYQVDASTIGIPLASAEDLAKIGVDSDYLLGGAYFLAADIDLSTWGLWEPIGTLADPFSGIFDGNGKTIRGLELSGGARDYTGLFGCLLNARLTNLTIEADTTATLIPTIMASTAATTTAAGAGVAAGYIDSSYINNITIRGTVTLARAGNAANEFDAGALAGVIRNSDVSRITVDMNLEAAGARLYAGLIAGRTLTGTMTFCQAEGRLDATSLLVLYVGGIVGEYTGPLENCASAASVYAAGLDEMNVGGIAGQASSAQGTPPVISCSLRSDHPVTIQGKSLATAAKAVYVGGITGRGIADTCLVDADVEIIAETVGTPTLYAGGIAGEVYGGGVGVINSFVRQGTVRAKAPAYTSATTSTVLAGGIAGSLSTNGVIENCFSGADVTVECALNLSNKSTDVVAAGGVLGGSLVAASITKSGSSGTVSAASSHSTSVAPVFAGGIMGRHQATTLLTLKQCAALGTQITAESTGSGTPYAYRILGGAFTGSGASMMVLTESTMLSTANLVLGHNYGDPDMTVQTKSGAGEWELVPTPVENNSATYMGDNFKLPLTQDFFDALLNWDFTATWGWAANLPYPLTN
jgi:hypothetical protein